MKTNQTRYKRFAARGGSILMALAFAVVLVSASAWMIQSGEKLEVELKAATQKELVDGDLEGAIAGYKSVVAHAGTNRAIAAKALVQMGKCYEKLGTSEAQKAYQQVLRDYADQLEQVELARSRLAVLNKGAAEKRGLATRRVWAGPKTEFSGSVSPDGKYISFVDWDTGDLAIRDLERETNRRLTNKGSWESNSDEEADDSIWSPDSRHIAYLWLTLKGYELRLIGLDDHASRVLYRCSNYQDYIKPLDWSRNGKYILAITHQENADWKIVLLSVADGTVRVLKTISKVVAGAAISPDGRYVLYDYPQTDSSLAHDIYIMQVEGGTDTPLVKYPADDLVLGWAQEGRWVLFTSDRRGSVGVWAIKTEDGMPNGDPLMVKPTVGRIKPLGLTRSGLFYYGIGGGSFDVYVATLDPATGRSLAPSTKLVRKFEGLNHSPNYSPDGKYLTYVSLRGSTQTSAGWGDTLCIRSLESGEDREYQREFARLGVRIISRPRLSPDGQSALLFGRDYRGGYGVYHLNLGTGRADCIRHQEKDLFVNYAEGWRNNNSFLYATRSEKNDQTQILLRTLGSGAEKVLLESTISAMENGAYSVSRDGRWLSTIGRMKSGEIILNVISTDDGTIKRQFRFAQEDFMPNSLQHAWSADGNYLLCTKRVATQGSYKFELWRVSLETGELQKTGFEMPGLIIHMSANPDGKRIAFENMAPMSASPAEVWVMENFLPK